MRVRFRTPTPAALDHIAEHVTAQDRLEIWEITAREPASALHEMSTDAQDAGVVEIDGAPAAFYGLSATGLVGGVAAPFFIQTGAARRAPRRLWLLAAEVVDLWSERAALLQNYVRPTNTRSIRWLRRIGFHVADEPQPVGPFGRPYLRFWRASCAR